MYHCVNQFYYNWSEKCITICYIDVWIQISQVQDNTINYIYHIAGTFSHNDVLMLQKKYI